MFKMIWMMQWYNDLNDTMIWMIQWSKWYYDLNDTMIQMILWSKWYYDPNDKMIHMIQIIWMKYKNKLVGSLKFPKCTQWSEW